jgi:archaetidylinositol phosphate synthase
MVLDNYRGTSNKLLLPVARQFSGLHPNTISAVSVVFAIIAGIAFTFANKSKIEDIFNPGHYIYIMFAIASVCVFLNGFLDAVDGQVARITGKTSKRGDFLDHAFDRYADIFILGGIMLSPYCNNIIGALAIIAVLMTSYMGTQAQALGCGRFYGGILGRADRLVILIIAPLIQLGLNYYYPSGKIPIPWIWDLSILEITMIWFIIAGNFTAVHRGVHSWRELRETEEPIVPQKTLEEYSTDVIGSGTKQMRSSPETTETPRKARKVRYAKKPAKVKPPKKIAKQKKISDEVKPKLKPVKPKPIKTKPVKLKTKPKSNVTKKKMRTKKTTKPKRKIKPKETMKLKSGKKKGKVKSKGVSPGGKRVQRPVKKMKSPKSPKRKENEPEVEIIWE